MKELKLLTLLLITVFTNVYSQQQWKQLGPEGGYYQYFQFDGKGNTYVASSYEILKSTNSGDTWSKINMPYLNKESRYVNNYVVLKSGKIFVEVYSYTNIDTVYVSDANGTNWVKSNVFPLQINPNGEVWGIDYNDKLYKSVNDGVTWNEELSPAVIIKAFFAITNENYIVYDKDGNIYTTFDGGKTFEQTKATTNSYTSSFFKDSKQNIFIVDNYKVARSKDNGKTWQGITMPIKLPTYLRLAESNTGELLLCAKNEIYKSTDEGNTWSLKWQFNSSTLDIAINNNDMFCSINYDGVFKFNKAQNLWEKKSSGLYERFSRISNIGNTLILNNFSYIYKSTDMGSSWKNVAPTSLINNFTVHNSGILSYKQSNGNFMFTLDKGETWEELSLLNSGSVNSLMLINANYFFSFSSANNTIYQSNDKGKSWYPVWFLGNFGTNQPSSFAFKNEFEIYFSHGNKVYKSKNHGKDWTLQAEITSEERISKIVISPYGHLFAICSLTVYDISIGIPRKLEIPDIGGGEVDIKFSEKGMMYIYSWYKFYQSDDFGVTVKEILNGYPEKVYSATVIENSLFTLTNYAGVFTTQLESVTPKKYPERFIANNFPNPFNGITNIVFYNEKQQKISLRVFDILGREIETIVSTELPQGFYKYSWSSKNISSGIYFYQLTTEDYSETKKMVILN